MLQALLALAERVDSATYRCHTLTDVEVESFDKGSVDPPATRRKHFFDPVQGTEHDAVLDPHKTPAPVRLDNLSVKQCGQRQPPRLRSWPCVLASLWLNPMTKMRQKCRAIILEAISQKQRYTAWRQHLGHLMHDALCHRQGAAAHINHHQQFAPGVHHPPRPIRRALQAPDG